MWTWLAVDLLTGTVRDELPLTAAAFSVELNGSGGFDATAPIKAVDSSGYSPVQTSVIDPGRTIIYGLRDGVVLCAAIVWATQADLGRGEVRIAGRGLFSYYERRHIRSTLTYAAADQFTIVSGVLGHVHSLGAGNPLDLSVTWPALSGVSRDRTYYGFERKQVAEAITQLAEVDGGFDFSLDVAGEPGSFTHELCLHHPRRGRRTSMVWDAQKNVVLLSWSRDAGRQANELTAIGAGEGDDMLVSLVSDPAMLATYPLLQDATTYKSVANRSTLDAHAYSDLGVRKQPVDLVSVEIVESDPDSRLGGFVPGDDVRVRASEGYVDFDAECRVQSYSVRVDANGAERVTVDLAVVGYYSLGTVPLEPEPEPTGPPPTPFDLLLMESGDELELEGELGGLIL